MPIGLVAASLIPLLIPLLVTALISALITPPRITAPLTAAVVIALRIASPRVRLLLAGAHPAHPFGRIIRRRHRILQRLAGKLNLLPLRELELRWEIDPSHIYHTGIDETMSIDQTKHSLFGASKVAADVLVQEYGRYFGMKTAIFRGGCLTGPAHAGTELHGFLAYLMKCTATGRPYRVFGYKGKQVRDNIHSHDLVEAFWQFTKAPRSGEVYNMGGSRHSNCSMLEAIGMCEKISGKKLDYTYVEDNRIGDHIWYISDVRKFQKHYPNWKYQFDLQAILEQIHAAVVAS